jgi:hypothetical protein
LCVYFKSRVRRPRKPELVGTNPYTEHLCGLEARAVWRLSKIPWHGRTDPSMSAVDG